MARPSKQDARTFIVSSVDLGKVLGVSRQRVQQYATEGMPREGPNRYDLRKAIPWLRERWQDRSGSKPLDLARQREAEARTSKHHIELETLRGSLVYTADATELLGSVAAWTSSELESIAGRVQADQRIRSAIVDECRAATARIAARVRQCAESLRSSGKTRALTDTAPEADGG